METKKDWTDQIIRLLILIGLLVPLGLGVVMAVLNSARDESLNKAIESMVRTSQPLAELYYLETQTFEGVCEQAIAATFIKYGREHVCNDTDATYAVASPQGDGSFVCTDNLGAFGITDTALADELQCPPLVEQLVR